ncbi:DUF429 domain-containing protein [candidate division KSB1 bacterium]|nr:DUF429 domain-containing protein [candidate division KSB1 bacterium]
METTSLKYAGVDGCHDGWFLVSIDEHYLNFSVAIFRDIKTLWLASQNYERILIDIPIGLSNSKPRQCDILARKILKAPRGSSVFPAPTRDAVYAGSYEEAKEINFKLLGKKISKQTWNISKKIREVDELFAELKNATAKIRESHPEICFWALAGGKPMDFPKKSNQGIEERLQLLQNHCQLSEKIFSEAKLKYPRKELAKDDILDALALAITAAAPVETLCTIPEIPERDDINIAMEIVFTNRFLN